MKTKLFVFATAVLFLAFGINTSTLSQNKNTKSKAPVKTEQLNKKAGKTGNVTTLSDNKEKMTSSMDSTGKEKNKAVTKSSGKEIVHHKIMTDKKKTNKKEKTSTEKK